MSPLQWDRRDMRIACHTALLHIILLFVMDINHNSQKLFNLKKKAIRRIIFSSINFACASL